MHFLNQRNIDPIVSIKIDGYQDPVGTPTEATKGGVLLYVSDELNFKPRPDQKYMKQVDLNLFLLKLSI